ncbi:MAG: hypothetical protein MUE41_03965 [Gemmatimonadaceae bacterium]|jgi:hypothetical protein|nr:hypothetical protein [Gemmatimonadaceae bacterium]
MSLVLRAVALVVLTSSSAVAQVAFTGAPVTQNFNSLPSTGTSPFAGLLPGWASSQGDLVAGTGSSNTGALYSFGATGSTDRALGSVASGGTGTIAFGLWLTNNTGQTLNQFTLAYTGEQWRRGDNVANALQFAYGLGATGLTTGTFVDVASLSFTAPTTSGSNTALDGNAAGNRTARSATVTGLTWTAGQSLWLRWQDINDAGADDGLAVDDLTFTAAGPTVVIPEPSTTALLASGVGVLLLVVMGRARRGA